MVAGFIRASWVHWSSPWVLAGLSGVAGFIGVRPGIRRVNLGLLWSALGIVRFCYCRWIYCGASLGSSGSSGVVLFIRVHPGVVGFIRVGWVHWGASWGSSGSSGFVGVRPGVRRVDPGSLGSLGCALAVVVFIRVRWVHWSAPWGSPGSSRVVEFSRVCAGVCWVHAWSLS